VRPQLKSHLERGGGEFALTGVLAAVVPVFIMMAKCANAGVPWALTDDDFSNAFNAVSQRALFEATQRLAPVAPELAASMLRAQAQLPPEEEATHAWREALERLMAGPRPGAWGGRRGEASSAYADDTHSGGWVVSCIIKSLRRVARAREKASLSANPAKCRVL